MSTEKAIFAGGCFWCIEAGYSLVPGVIKAIAGYTGGTTEHPSYKEVSSGITDHREAVEITYDPTQVSYEKLVDIFLKQIDPTDSSGQFADRGFQYTTAIYYTSDKQKKIADEALQKLEESGKFNSPIVTSILPASTFYPAEDYHQKFFQKEPAHYEAYSKSSGRKAFIEKMWQSEAQEKKFIKPSDEELKKKLTSLQYDVTQSCGTESPFDNTYWDNHEDGIYVDIVTGEPLFSSKDKFESGTGWPSFSKPLEPKNVTEKSDFSHGMTRTEVCSAHGNSHLGHVFPDGPRPTGQRYCINSAALRFIPKKDLVKEGYGEYVKLFE